MSPSLPHISGAEAIRALERLGFVVARQKGSHVVLRRGASGCVVPNHREIKVGTLSGVLKQADVSQEDFLAALRS
jgi:predicted RNA binding protein YcfA (HicA-like mRNA interferase family)